jgi:hypothetical protein
MENLKLRERISNLTHYGNLYCLTTILISQVIYLNFHFIVGATLSVVAVSGLFFQVLISLLEYRYLNIKKYETLSILFHIHFIINHIIMIIFVPFLIWVIVLMFKHEKTV